MKNLEWKTQVTLLHCQGMTSTVWIWHPWQVPTSRYTHTAKASNSSPARCLPFIKHGMKQLPNFQFLLLTLSYLMPQTWLKHSHWSSQDFGQCNYTSLNRRFAVDRRIEWANTMEDPIWRTSWNQARAKQHRQHKEELEYQMWNSFLSEDTRSTSICLLENRVDI